MDTLNSIKFQHPTVASAVEEIFGGPAKRVLVVHDVESDEVIKEAQEQYGIEIWLMRNLLSELDAAIKTGGHRDDVLRLLQLLHYSR